MQPEKKVRSSRPSNSAITIDEVARRAGVSTMTVSRVLNGKPGVSVKTRAHIEQIIQELNYVPSLAARGLASASSCRIGLVYTKPQGAYMSEFLTGILDEISRCGSSLHMHRCDDLGEAEEIARMLTREVDGVILPPPFCDSAAMTGILHAAGRSVIAVGTTPVGAYDCAISIDDYSAASEMTQYLLEQGHRRIAFIKGDPGHGASIQRFEGFMDTLSAAGVVPDAIETGDFSYRSGIDAAARMLTSRYTPTAVFASNDDMASAFVSVAHRRGIEVPRDLSVVGFDNTLLAMTTWPELTTVNQPISDMASAAVDLLLRVVLARRAGEPAPHKHLTLKHALVIRDSVAPPRG